MSEARLLDLSEADYHADTVGDETPTLSASMANILATKSPMHAYLAHPKLGGNLPLPTEAMEKGSIFHGKVLGSELDLEIVEADAWRSKEAKQTRADARARGALPVLGHKLGEITIKAERIRERIAELGIDLDGGLTEQAATWTEYATDGTPVPCRCRMDKVWLEEGRILDFKTKENVAPDACAKAMIDYGYAIQDAAYRRCVEALVPELVGRVSMEFLFCETEPPFAVTPAYCSGAMREIGQGRWQRAVDTWAQCLASDKWPGYVTAPVSLEPPGWVLAREMEIEE